MHHPIQTVRKIFYMILGITGVPINVMTIAILSRGKCGLSACTIRYLLAMATVDLLFVIFEIILSKIKNDYFPASFLDITPVCSVRYALRRVITDCSVWFTIAFTLDRHITICYEKLKSKYCTQKTATIVLATTGILFCLKNIPIYFRFRPSKIVDNIKWGCSNSYAYSANPVWEAFNDFEKILTPLVPFALILFLNALTVTHIFVASRIRKGLKCKSNGNITRDPEIEKRKQSVILLLSISGSFIFLWLWYILYYFDVDDPLDSNGEYTFKHVAYMLRNLNCCTNTIVYVATLSKFREKFRKPLEAIFK